ncbi:MAG: peptidoglycan recognition family protein [Dehalococcoidia bacterium]
MFPSDAWGFRIDGHERVAWQGRDVELPYQDIAGGCRVYDVRHLFPDLEAWVATVAKRGYTVHHDAVVMRDEDRNYSGTTLDEDLDRLGVIYRYHVNANGERPGEAGWNGIGYHRVVSPAGRIFITGASSTHRAHAKGWDWDTSTTYNHSWIGWCLMGDHSAARPPETQMRALRAGLQWETNQRGVEMALRPHKFLTPDTDCPGSWAAVDAWHDVTLRPQAVEPPTAPPAAAEPAPAPPTGMSAVAVAKAALVTCRQVLTATIDRLP